MSDANNTWAQTLASSQAQTGGFLEGARTFVWEYKLWILIVVLVVALAFFFWGTIMVAIKKDDTAAPGYKQPDPASGSNYLPQDKKMSFYMPDPGVPAQRYPWQNQTASNPAITSNYVDTTNPAALLSQGLK